MNQIKKQKRNINLQQYVAKLIVDSENTELLNQYINNIINTGKRMGLPLKGPISLPTTVLKLSVRKSPTGEGCGTHAKLIKKIYKKVLYVYNERLLEFIMKSEINNELNIELKIV